MPRRAVTRLNVPRNGRFVGVGWLARKDSNLRSPDPEIAAANPRAEVRRDRPTFTESGDGDPLRELNDLEHAMAAVELDARARERA